MLFIRRKLKLIEINSLIVRLVNKQIKKLIARYFDLELNIPLLLNFFIYLCYLMHVPLFNFPFVQLGMCPLKIE